MPVSTPDIAGPIEPGAPVIDPDRPTEAPGIPPGREKVTGFVQRLAYGAGSLANQTGKNAPKTLATQIYNIELGVNPALIGLAVTISRLVDAFTDPLMGSITDNFESRWGRRRPLIALGALLVGAVFTLMWWFPTNMSVNFYTVYMFLFVILHYVALTVFSVPYYALGYEMTPHTRERNAIMAYAGLFGAGAAILISWIYALAHLSIFESPLQGIRWVGLGVGVMLVVTGVLPALLIRERRVAPVKVANKPVVKMPMWRSIRQCLALRQFRQLMFMMTLVLIGGSMVSGLGFYVITYYMFRGDTASASVLFGIISTVAQVGNFVMIPLAIPAANRFGKRHVTVFILAAAFAGSLLKWFCYTPAFPYLAIIPSIMLTPVFAVVSNMLVHSMIGDICDLDELEHGVRREGLYGAVFSWTFKVGVALSSFVGGAILVAIGFNAEFKGNQSEATLLWMRLLFAFVPAVFILAGYLIFRSYDLTNARMEAVRVELDQRRAEAE